MENRLATITEQLQINYFVLESITPNLIFVNSNELNTYPSRVEGAGDPLYGSPLDLFEIGITKNN